jgi:plasmanylethanolamine desaturase
MTAEDYSMRHRLVEIAALAAAGALSGVLIVRLALVDPAWLPLAGIAAILGYLAADLLSGLVHWIFDTWGDESTPVLGPAFIAPFREHHRDPASITRHDFIETNGNTAIPIVPVLTAACLIPLDTGTGVFASTFVMCTSLGVLATNQIHKWAHTEEVVRVVRLLQRSHLILPVTHHRRHHAPPYASHYCITTGWMNPLLTALDVHRRVERAVRRPCDSRLSRSDSPGGERGFEGGQGCPVLRTIGGTLAGDHPPQGKNIHGNAIDLARDAAGAFGLEDSRPCAVRTTSIRS